MPREHVTATKRATLAAAGLLSILLLACIIPSSLSPKQPTPEPSPTARAVNPPTATPTTAPLPNGTVTVSKISEQDMNDWLKAQQPQLGDGLEAQDLQVKIQSTGLLFSANVRVAQLQNALVPIQILARPAVSNGHVDVNVLDVQLGGSYASFSALLKPLVTTGLAQAFDADSFLAKRGVRITSIDLQDGYLLVTTQPTGS